MRILLLTFIFFTTTIIARAQCVISGPGTIAVGSTGNYSISSSLGQCTECYDWDVVSGNVSISGTDQHNSVTIQANGTGSFQIRVTYFDEDGCHQCIVNGSVPCDVTQDGIYFVNALGDVNLKFYTMPSVFIGGPNSFSYYWIFTYADHSTSWSYDREPYIPVPCDNPLTDAYVQVSSSSCYLEFTKHYQGIGICGTAGMKSSGPAPRNIRVVPNPTNSQIHFEGLDLAKYTVSIFDPAGNEVIQSAVLTKTIDLSKQTANIYIYVIKGADGTIIQRGKIVKN